MNKTMQLFKDFFWRTFKKKPEKIYAKIYRDISELPIWNWVQIMKKKDLKYLYKDDDYGHLKSQESFVEVWDEMYLDYLNRFGLTNDYMDVLEKRKLIAKKQIRIAVYNDTAEQTFLEIEELELEDMLKKYDKYEFTDNLANLEASLKFIIDPKVLSTEKYFSHIKRING